MKQILFLKKVVKFILNQFLQKKKMNYFLVILKRKFLKTKLCLHFFLVKNVCVLSMKFNKFI